MKPLMKGMVFEKNDSYCNLPKQTCEITVNNIDDDVNGDKNFDRAIVKE